MVNLQAEAMVVPEVIFMDIVTVGLIIFYLFIYLFSI